ncbi:hypothetical protein BDY19DRAFT_949645 [Irpex rosettiformis]|uniref:Uncharacterized protein n=1 Tax=Irpex rosettiformis TaxID=378272 RepID=A0ACB8U1W8_9APHY|nr:hypothetical protein BDY19DRAFT_949645 [Irpex rosettiformis]
MPFSVLHPTGSEPRQRPKAAPNTPPPDGGYFPTDLPPIYPTGPDPRLTHFSTSIVPHLRHSSIAS